MDTKDEKAGEPTETDLESAKRVVAGCQHVTAAFVGDVGACARCIATGIAALRADRRNLRHALERSQKQIEELTARAETAERERAEAMGANHRQIGIIQKMRADLAVAKLLHHAAAAQRPPDWDRVVVELQEQLATAQARVKSLESELFGDECKDTECADYDGEHPYHQTAYIKGHDAGVQKHSRPAQEAAAQLLAALVRVATLEDCLRQTGPLEFMALHARERKLRSVLERVGRDLDGLNDHADDCPRKDVCAHQATRGCDDPDCPRSKGGEGSCCEAHEHEECPECECWLATREAVRAALSDSPPAAAPEWNPTIGPPSPARPDLFPAGSTVSETRFGVRVDVPAATEAPSLEWVEELRRRLSSLSGLLHDQISYKDDDRFSFTKEQVDACLRLVGSK